MDASKVQTQIGVSISLARNLVASWLPPLTEEEKKIEAENARIADNVLTSRRKPGAGLGSNAEKDETAELSLEEIKIKRRLQQKDKKAKEHAREILAQKAAKKQKSMSGQDGDSDDQEEMVKGKKRSDKRAKVSTSSFDRHTARGEKRTDKAARGFGR